MAKLTLTPYRCALPTDFAQSSYAYCYADRPVRVKGELVTAKGLYDSASEDGRLDFEIPSSHSADDGFLFSYTVAAFDPTSRRMWIHNIVMPDEDTSLFALVPQIYDKDEREFIPKACSCGLDPRVITATMEFDFGLESSYLMLRYPDEYDAIAVRNRFEVLEQFTVQITEDNSAELNFQFRRTPSFIYPASQVAGTADPYDHVLNTDAELLRPEDFTVGNYIRMYFDGDTNLVVTSFDTTIDVPTQTQIDTFVACIDAGGVAEQPDLPEPTDPPEEIT